jgi:hypothetical protein
MRKPLKSTNVDLLELECSAFWIKAKVINTMPTHFVSIVQREVFVKENTTRYTDFGLSFLDKIYGI